MSYKPRTLFRLIEEINVSLFLPHIQRPFVWDEDQIRRLFDSLMRDYPIQTLLFWRTKDRIMARKFMSSVEWDADLSELYDKPKSDQGVEKVFVLDGQQRLQSLFAVFNGALKSSDGKRDLKAYFEGVIAPVPGIMRLFWAFSSSNPPESPSQEDSSLANMLDTLEARCRSDGPPAGPRSIDPLPGSRSFLTVSAVA